MSNRFLLATSSAAATAASTSGRNANAVADDDPFDPQNNNHSVDTDFDLYWEEEARNPHRNRIRIGRQYQATVPPLLKSGEKDQRKLDELETLSFCPKKSARVSDAELDHYFTVAKSLNLFASLVETRSLLGRDVTIADLNHIRNKEGLSLASVIQPIRQQTSTTSSSGNYSSSLNISPPSSHQSQQASTLSGGNNNTGQTASISSQNLQNSAGNSNKSSTNSLSSPTDEAASIESFHFNPPLMKALSHFISLHHPCQHDQDCKKLLKDIPLEDDSVPAVSITAGNLRQGSSHGGSKEAKPGRSRSSLKSQQSASTSQALSKDGAMIDSSQDDQQLNGGDNLQSPTYEDWTREEVELFSKAIEVCGKNFSSIKKEFLPSKSVRSIVEYYYIGSRDATDSKKKSSQPSETTNDVCSSSEKNLTNNNGQGGGSGPSAGGKSGTTLNSSNPAATSSSRTTTAASSNDSSQPNKSLSDTNEETKQAANLQQDVHPSKTVSTPKHQRHSDHAATNSDTTNSGKTKSKSVDPRMSVYNFDEELKEDGPVQFDCPRPGAEVRPLRANPIIPNELMDPDATNSNVGSLKFFMDGQLVLKLNACQDQQEGIEKCHWVQSGDKVINSSKQKRYTKRADRSLDFNQTNGSQSNSVISSFQDDDSKNDDLTGDEDSKESMSSSISNLPQQKNHIQRSSNHGSPTSKRLKIKSEPNNSGMQQQQNQLPSPINYNKLAVNNRMKDRNDNLNPNPIINQAMPWIQANSLAVAAALLSGLPFTPTTGSSMIDNAVAQQNNINSVNLASKPMDLSLEHSVPKAIQKSSSRSSRSKPKNNN